MSRVVILRNFSFNRDFRSVLWKQTLWYNLLRNFCAGIVIGIILAFKGESIGRVLYYPLMWPLSYILVTPFLLLIFNILGSFLPILKNAPAFLAIIMVSLGDPIVSILYNIYPKIVPVSNPPFFSTNLIFWVLDAEDETAIAGNLFNQNNNSNYIS